MPQGRLQNVAAYDQKWRIADGHRHAGDLAGPESTAAVRRGPWFEY